MTKKASTPALRFKGFTYTWEQRKLGDCFTERVESMPDGELISVTINDGIKKFSELGRHDNSNDDKSKYKKVCVGDIAYNSMRMWQGASGYSPYEGIVSPAYTVLSPNLRINSKCLAYQFKLPEMIHTFQINSQGITSDNWNLKYPALSDIEIFVSKDEEEQAKIAKCFEGFDHLITLHQRKYDKLTNMKKSMLEKMFPKNGANVPEIRFKGFTDAWEQRKLGDIVQITMGQSPDGSTYSDVPSDYILVQGNADLQNGWVCPKVWTSQMTKKADAGDLIMSVRAPAGTMGKTTYNVVIGRGVAAIKGNDFIYQLLVKMDIDGFWKALSCGSTFESLNSGNIKNAEVLIPDIDEQEKIGQYFTNLDRLITLHQRELEKLKNLKKACLEKMFV